jgi:hypothetical protein
MIVAVVFLFSAVVSLIRPGPVSSPRAFAKQSSVRSKLLKSLLHVSKWVIMNILEALFKTKKLQTRGGGRTTQLADRGHGCVC